MVDEMSTLHKSGTSSLSSFMQGHLQLVVVGIMQSKFAQMVRLINLRLALLPKGKLRYLG